MWYQWYLYFCACMCSFEVTSVARNSRAPSSSTVFYLIEKFHLIIFFIKIACIRLVRHFFEKQGKQKPISSRTAHFLHNDSKISKIGRLQPLFKVLFVSIAYQLIVDACGAFYAQSIVQTLFAASLVQTKKSD